jgi:hypothetical protein
MRSLVAGHHGFGLCVVAALSALVLVACGTGGDTSSAPTPQPSLVPSSTTLVPSTAPSIARLPVPVPSEPEVGIPYAYDLYTHCDIEFAHFAGRTWKTEKVVPEPDPTPDERGVTVYTGYTSGTVTLIDETTAEFANDQVGTVRFHAIEYEPAPCQ